MPVVLDVLCSCEPDYTISYLELSFNSELTTVPLYSPRRSRGAVLHFFDPSGSPRARVREFLESGYHVLSLPLEPGQTRGFTAGELMDIASAHASLIDEAPPGRSYVSISPEHLYLGADLARRIGADLICIFPED